MEKTFKNNIFIFTFYFGYTWSSILCQGFLQLQGARSTFIFSAHSSHCGGFPCCRTLALGLEVSVFAVCLLWSRGSIAVSHKLSCSMVCGVLLDQDKGSRLWLLPQGYYQPQHYHKQSWETFIQENLVNLGNIS